MPTPSPDRARPTLIEWDTDVPDWPALEAEAARAAAVLGRGAGMTGGGCSSRRQASAPRCSRAAQQFSRKLEL